MARFKGSGTEVIGTHVGKEYDGRIEASNQGSDKYVFHSFSIFYRDSGGELPLRGSIVHDGRTGECFSGFKTNVCYRARRCYDFIY